MLSGIRAVLCEPIEDARDVHLDLPAANSLKGYATGRSFGCAKLIMLARQQADAGAFSTGTKHLECLRLMCSRCTRTHLGSAKAPGVAHLGSLFFSDASTGFPESRRAWLQTKENPARGGLSAGFVLSASGECGTGLPRNHPNTSRGISFRFDSSRPPPKYAACCVLPPS